MWKSTLLKALSRLLLIKGQIILDGESIHTQSTKELLKIAILPQSPE